MTLAAIKKLAIQLTPKQRLQLADELYDSVPVFRGSVGLAELERRAAEVESGKVRTIPADKVLADLKKLIRSKSQTRLRQRA